MKTQKGYIMKFIPMLMVAGALLASATTVSAQTRVNPNRSADQLNAQVLEVLRGREAAPAPVVAAPVAATSAPVTNTGTGIYVGAGVGSTFQDGVDYQVGGVVGYQFTPNLAAELTYDYQRLSNNTDGQMVMGNVVYSRPLNFPGVTPYVLAGAGVGWNAMGEPGTGDNLALYNVGGGVRVNVYRNLDLDARYRYVGAFDEDVRENAHVVTLGIVARF
jgi:opacity protein-like surface antigen